MKARSILLALVPMAVTSATWLFGCAKNAEDKTCSEAATGALALTCGARQGDVQGFELTGAPDEKPDFKAAKRAGKAFAVIHALDGKAQNPQFQRMWRDSLDAGLIRGPVHYFYPSTKAAYAREQADAYIALVKRVGGIKRGDLPPILDLERLTEKPAPFPRTGTTPSSVRTMTESAPNTPAPVAPSTDTAAEPEYDEFAGAIAKEDVLVSAETWLKRVEAETKRKPILMTNTKVARYLGQDLSKFKDYPLWISDTGKDAKTECPEMPETWSQWSFWTYTVQGEVKGSQGSFLLSTFNGSVTDLRRIAGENVASPPGTSTPMPWMDAGLDASPDDASAPDEPVVDSGFATPEPEPATEPATGDDYSSYSNSSGKSKKSNAVNKKKADPCPKAKAAGEGEPKSE